MLLWLCFTISGAAALALEVLWMRSASLALGGTATTTATVLGCYFAGLALGGAAARRGSPLPVRRYALLELGVAAGGAWSLAVFQLSGTDAVQRLMASAGSVGAIAVVALAILPSTVCLGATLPALGQAVADATSVGRRGGFLYALNTLGAAGGAAAAGFGLPALIGVRASYAAAMAASATAALLAFIAGEPTRSPTEDVRPVAHPPRLRLRLVAGGAGALGLTVEVLWTRLFAQVLHNSVYSFAAVAIVFLLALAAGAGLAALLLRRIPAASTATVALLAAGAATIGGYWSFLWWTGGLGYVGMQSGLGEYLFRVVALAAATAGPAALAAGVVLPTLWAAWGDTDRVARPLGDLSAASMLGGAAGALVTGFVVVPAIGLQSGLLVAAVGYVALAQVLPATRAWLRPLALALLVAMLAANPAWGPLVALRQGRDTLRATLEGANGIVSVVEADGDLQLRVDNYYVLGGTAAATNERRLGLLPLLLHPDPRHVTFIGLATGITASAAPALGVEHTTVVELIPEVAAAARDQFAPWNQSLLDRPDVHLVLDDGRRYLAATQEPSDVIVSDLFVPWHAGTGSLYSRQMYETVARRLAPGGLFCQWLPLYQLTREEFDVIARTFLDVFPATELWRDDFYPDRPVVGLVGRLAARPVDLERVDGRVRRLPAWGRDPLLASPRGLAMLHVAALDQVPDLFARASLNTDDRPVIEFLAPRLTRMDASGDKDWFTGESLATFYDALAPRTATGRDPFAPSALDVAAARRAGTALFRFALAAARHDVATSDAREAEVRALVPEVILTAEATAVGADDRQVLAGLRAEEADVRRQIEELESRLGRLTGDAR